jgi:hypothetical protein
VTLKLSLSADQATLTAVSDKRIHPAVTQDFTITVTASGESTTYSGTRVVTPASVDPITVTDSSGKVWAAVSDDGVTAVFR